MTSLVAVILYTSEIVDLNHLSLGLAIHVHFVAAVVMHDFPGPDDAWGTDSTPHFDCWHGVPNLLHGYIHY